MLVKRNLVLVSAIMLVLITPTLSWRNRCATRKVYYFSAEKTTWAEAQSRCADLDLQLASILTDTELNEFHDGRKLAGIDNAWIAGYRSTSGNVFNWQWNLGSMRHLKSMSFSKWGANEPDSVDGNKCVVINADKWSNYGCGESRYYACEDIK